MVVLSVDRKAVLMAGPLADLLVGQMVVSLAGSWVVHLVDS